MEGEKWRERGRGERWRKGRGGEGNRGAEKGGEDGEEESLVGEIRTGADEWEKKVGRMGEPHSHLNSIGL